MPPPPPPPPSYSTYQQPSSYMPPGPSNYMPPAPAYPPPSYPSYGQDPSLSGFKSPFSSTKYVTTKAMLDFYSKNRPPIHSALDSLKDVEGLAKGLRGQITGGFKGLRDLINLPGVLGKIPGADTFKVLKEYWKTKDEKRGKQNQGNYYPNYPPALQSSTDYAPQSSYRVPQPDYSQSMYGPPPQPYIPPVPTPMPYQPYVPPQPDTPASYDAYTPIPAPPPPAPYVPPPPPLAPQNYAPAPVASTAAPVALPSYVVATLAPIQPTVAPIPPTTTPAPIPYVAPTQAPATQAPTVIIYTPPMYNPQAAFTSAPVIFGVPPPSLTVSADMSAPSGPWSAPDPMPFRPSMPFPSEWQSSSNTNNWPPPIYARNMASQSVGTTAPSFATDASTTAAPVQDMTVAQPVTTTAAPAQTDSTTSGSPSYAIKSRSS